MLEKIQSISTNLDKKRVYTAVGALVVALATGHVMQRTVNQPNAPVDARVQQAQVTQGQVIPAMSTPPAAPVETAQATPEPLPVPAKDAAPDEVTKADNAPATDPIAPLPEPQVADRPAPDSPTSPDVMRDDRIAASAPEREEQAEPIETAARPDQGLVEPLEIAEVSRAATTEDLPRPALPETQFDVAPADVIAQPETDETAAEDCTPTLSLAPLPGALIYTELRAPCDAGGEVQFDHAGLKFTETLDQDGALTVMVPAMTREAAITATFGDQEKMTEARIQIEDMDDYDRIALIWKGGTGLQLHALENGAYYGEEGHVWAEEPGLPARATDGQGGFITVLGSTTGGYAADVYTYPVSMPTAPAVSIEAQVLETTCEQAIVGDYLRSVQNGQPTGTQVGMVVPDCDAVGEYLVLKNLPQDLTIARN
ncbi:hypothetical protein BD830_102344 [Maritimibacter alkaliphilus HTCC2654]|uniref:Possible TolA protein n=1 Tax=Maritimibacter alkaliphilus HTCC2654 TaxID=314271 RepID=A3VD30_9RHOB|nr:hypothetical protein [Maritimibacter alkaliphilus]EAQ14059.1 Possible TolA protein [Maritimibacter alkaliphilus HTCC2654]TYP84253.1 hypothetical protein BD830_102344 [Maritimibacter alkaliphilus HTCC2654]